MAVLCNTSLWAGVVPALLNTAVITPLIMRPDYTVSQKRKPLDVWYELWQMWTDFQNSVTNWFVRTFCWLPPHLQYVATLLCESRKSKNVTDFDSILSKLLTCSWEHFEHLTVVRQTVSWLLTLSNWLTFWSLSDDISNQLKVVASWFFHHDYLRTVFIFSTLYFMCCTQI